MLKQKQKQPQSSQNPHASGLKNELLKGSRTQTNQSDAQGERIDELTRLVHELLAISQNTNSAVLETGDVVGTVSAAVDSIDNRTQANGDDAKDNYANIMGSLNYLKEFGTGSSSSCAPPKSASAFLRCVLQLIILFIKMLWFFVKFYGSITKQIVTLPGDGLSFIPFAGFILKPIYQTIMSGILLWIHIISVTILSGGYIDGKYVAGEAVFMFTKSMLRLFEIGWTNSDIIMNDFHDIFITHGNIQNITSPPFEKMKAVIDRVIPEITTHLRDTIEITTESAIASAMGDINSAIFGNPVISTIGSYFGVGGGGTPAPNQLATRASLLKNTKSIDLSHFLTMIRLTGTVIHRCFEVSIILTAAYLSADEPTRIMMAEKAWKTSLKLTQPDDQIIDKVYKLSGNVLDSAWTQPQISNKFSNLNQTQMSEYITNVIAVSRAKITGGRKTIKKRVVKNKKKRSISTKRKPTAKRSRGSRRAFLKKPTRKRRMFA